MKTNIHFLYFIQLFLEREIFRQKLSRENQNTLHIQFCFKSSYLWDNVGKIF